MCVNTLLKNSYIESHIYIYIYGLWSCLNVSSWGVGELSVAGWLTKSTTSSGLKY